MEWKELRDKAKGNYEEAKRILQDPKATDEDRARVTSLVEEAKKWMAEVEQLKSIAAAADSIAGQIAEEAKSGHSGGSTEPPPEKFATWGEFLEQVYLAGHPGVKAPPDARLRLFKDRDEDAYTATQLQKKGRKDMAEGVGATGGYLVPPDFQTNLMSVMGEQGMVRGRATSIPMRRRQINIPVLDQTGTTAGIPHWFGGLQFYWEEEAAVKTPSDAKFRQIPLIAHKLIGYTRASDELVDDAAISLDAFLSGPMGFAGGVAWMEDYSFLIGPGGGQPLGVINAGCTLSATRSEQHKVDYVDLVDMLQKFLASDDALWSFSQPVITSLMTMQDPDGHYLWPTLFSGGAQQGLPGRLMGYPYKITEKQPTVGTAGDILLASWKYYLIGDRQATTVESTRFDRWAYDQTSWRVVHRVDGQPWLSAPLTLQDGSTQISPFVILGAKST